MKFKILITSILSFVLLTAKAQTSVGVGCTIPTCSGCIASYSGTWSSTNTSVATVSPTGDVTGVSFGTSTISYVFSIAGCGNGTFTSTVTVIPPFSVTGVSQSSPLTLSGDEAYTYCPSGGGFTLNVGTAPMSIPGATYTWDDGITTPSVVSTASFTPTYTSTVTAVTHMYTVSVSYGGCIKTTTVNVVVPASGCSPCTYYNVDDLRATRGLSAVGGCGGCSTLQPFHTIISSTLSAANVADNQNYYVVNTATLGKTAYNDDRFFMNYHEMLYVNTITPVTMNHCHLFSGCVWGGIDVAVYSGAAGRLTLNNSLIENVGAVGFYYDAVNVNASGSYYTGGMPNIVGSFGSIYNNNYGGIGIKNYAPTYSSGITAYPFSIENSVFTNRDLASGQTFSTVLLNYPFDWAPTTALKTFTVSPTDPAFNLDNYTSSTGIVTAHHGVAFTGVGTSSMISSGSSTVPATYAYNYPVLGSAAVDPSYNNTNVFDNIGIGVTFDYSNGKMYNNTFRHVSAGTGIASYGLAINDLKVIGNNADNTINRYFNCANYGIVTGGVNGSPRDFTCINALFTGPNSGNNTAIYLTSGGYDEHSIYNVTDNTIYNYYRGIQFTYPSIAPSSYSTLNGDLNIINNHISGKSPVGSYAENMYLGMIIEDSRPYSGGTSNGNINISLNVINGAQEGISARAFHENLTINDNHVREEDYSSGDILGIMSYSSPYLTVTDNVVGGFGYDCNSLSVGIRLNAIGASGSVANVSCNAVHDMYSGFQYYNTNYVDWNSNQMSQNMLGLDLENSAVIGTQGSSPCTPSDNHWDAASCGSCGSCSSWPGWGSGGVYETYAGAGVSAASSVLNVRSNTSPYGPTSNGAGVGGTAYSYGTSLIDLSACVSLPGTPGCAQSSAFRMANPKDNPRDNPSSAAAASNYTLYPNPGDGNVTITQSNATNEPVKVVIYNTLGQQVYNNTLQFNGGKANIKLKNSVPGFYQVKLSNGNNEVLNKTVVIQK